MTCKHQLAVGLLERVEQDECERAERETADLLAHFAPAGRHRRLTSGTMRAPAVGPAPITPLQGSEQ